MDKSIGFNRNIRLTWLDTTAAFCTEMDDGGEIRARLEPIIGEEISSQPNIRKTIDILLNIWLKSSEFTPKLRSEGLNHFQQTTSPDDRLWLHYGMTLMAFPFFYTAVTIIGQESRYEETITASIIRQRLYAEMGELGSVKEAIGRVINSLRDWGILLGGPRKNSYVPQRDILNASKAEIEIWLLACALVASPAEEMPAPDLLNLSAMFPFRFTVGMNKIRQSQLLEISLQGMGLKMVKYKV